MQQKDQVELNPYLQVKKNLKEDIFLWQNISKKIS